jgi:hypothetical protein
MEPGATSAESVQASGKTPASTHDTTKRKDFKMIVLKMIVFCITASSYIMRLYCRFALVGGEKTRKSQHIFINCAKIRLFRK